MPSTTASLPLNVGLSNRLEVLEPGTWIRIKRALPWRLRPVLLSVERFLFGGRGVAVKLDGTWIRCAVDALPDFSTHPDHIDDRALLGRVLSGLSPGDLFLDAGSHVGIYALGAASRVGERGRVVAIEPTPATVAKLRRNVALNHQQDRIEVAALAISDRPGTVEFVVTGTSMMNSIFSGRPNGQSRTGGDEQRIVVETRTLDSYFDGQRRTTVKIDTEGHEIRALAGAPRLLASSARVFVELHPWAWTSPAEGWAELLALAAASGRHPVRLDDRPLEAPEHTRIELVRR